MASILREGVAKKRLKGCVYQGRAWSKDDYLQLAREALIAYLRPLEHPVSLRDLALHLALDEDTTTTLLEGVLKNDELLQRESLRRGRILERQYWPAAAVEA